MKTAPTQNGRVSKSVSVSTDAPGVESLRLRFTVDVRMPIVAKPDFRFSLNTIEGHPAMQRLLLSRADGEPLIIRKTAEPLPGLTVTAQAVKEGSDVNRPGAEPEQTPWGAAEPRKGLAPAAGDVWVEMVADPSLAAGRYSGEVTLVTDDSAAPEIAIPYTVRVRPLIEARPNVVRLWTALRANDPGRSAIVTLSRYGGRKFTVTSVEVSHPTFFTAVAYNSQASPQQSIRVGLVEGISTETLHGSVEGWIRVTTDDPEMPRFEIPVLVAPNQMLSRRPVHGAG
jgi:hypothetical protein